MQVGGECLASFLYVLLVSLAEELVASSPGLPPSSRCLLASLLWPSWPSWSS